MPGPGVTAERRARRGTPGELGGRLGGLSLRRQVMVLATWPLLEQLMGFMLLLGGEPWDTINSLMKRYKK